MKNIITQCSAEKIKKALKTGDCQFVDVREGFEVKAEKAEGFIHLPLSSFEKDCLKALNSEKPVYLLCRSGARAKQAAEKLSSLGFKDLHVIEGGLRTWEKAGKKIVRTSSPIWDLERQVRFTAGALVLAGFFLSLAAPPFLILSAFVGAGLVFSALTNTCGMGMLLSRMPWNRAKKSESSCRSIKPEVSKTKEGQS